MFQFLTHVELSRSMAAILEMPQYVAYQKNVVYAFIKLSAKSHSFNILRTMDGLSCPTRVGVQTTDQDVPLLLDKSVTFQRARGISLLVHRYTGPTALRGVEWVH